MPRVKSASESAAKWAERAGNASGEYAQGVQNPKADWKDATVAAADAYKQGVQASIAKGSFARGVTKAGSEKQINNSLSKGVGRYSTGVAIAQNDYEAGVAPFLLTIERTNLPIRKAKGDPANIERVAKLAAALHAAKQTMR